MIGLVTNLCFFFFQAEDGIRDLTVTGVQTCALPISEALVRMGKVVISVDLNPLSRTSQRATIPIADELTRAILNTKKFVEELKENPEEAARIRRAYRRSGNLGAVYSFLEWRPGACCRGARRGLERSPAAWRKVHDPRRHLSKHQHPWYVH